MLTKKIQLLFLTLLLQFCCGTRTPAQQLKGIKHRVFSNFCAENSSIGTNTIYRIDDGPDGYLWLSTDVGLYKFDGEQFTLMNTGAYSDVVSTYKTSNNWLLLLLFNGKTRALDLATHQIINTDSLWQLDRLPNDNRPYLFAFEDSGRLIFVKKQINSGDIEGLIVQLNNHKATIEKINHILEGLLKRYHSYKPLDAMQLFDSWIKNNSHIHLSNNNLILNNNSFDKKSGQILLNGQREFPGSIVTSFEQTELGAYVGTLDKGLFFKPSNGQKEIENIFPYPVSNICQDYLGNIWVSTLSKGLFFFHKGDASTFYYDSKTSTIQKKECLVINSKRKFNLLYNNIGKILLYEVFDNQIFNIFNKCLQPIKIQNKLTELNIHKGNFLNFYNYSYDYLQLMAQNRFSYPWKDYYNIGDTILLYSIGSIQIIYPDHSQRQVEINKRLNINNTNTFQYINDEKIILGTTLGIFINQEKLKWLEQASFFKIRIIDSTLYCCTSRGVYCISLNQLHKKEHLQQISKESFNEIIIDDQYLYLNSKRKLMVIERSTKKIISERTFLNYTIPFLSNNCFVDADYVVFAASNGIFFFPKKNIIDTTSHLPKIHVLNSLQNFSPAGNSCTYLYKKAQRILLKLDILDYNHQPKKIRYKILKNKEEYIGWTEYQLKNLIELFDLAPGAYSIDFEISCADKHWNKRMRYDLVVHPLWYQSRWAKGMFLLFSLILLSFIGIWIVKMRLKKLSMITADKLKTLELEAQALNAQINPHFIFNALLPFQDFTIRGESDKALSYINKFSKLMRGILTNSRIKSVSIADELQFIKTYLEIQQERFEHSFDFEINYHNEIDTKLHIPTLFLQPIVENALEHGIYKLPYRGKITIDIQNIEEKGAIQFTITDNGKGFDIPFTPKKNHVLEIIMERLYLLQRKTQIGTIQFKNKRLYGAVIIIILPIIRK